MKKAIGSRRFFHENRVFVNADCEWHYAGISGVASQADEAQNWIGSRRAADI